MEKWASTFMFLIIYIPINYLQFGLSILFMLSPTLETLAALDDTVDIRYNPFKYYFIVTFK